MEKHMKLFTLLTKPFVLFVLLFTLGVGNVWADVWVTGPDWGSWRKSDAYKFSDGKLELNLAANTDYTFKVYDEVGYDNNHYRSWDLQSGKITNTILKYNMDKDNVDGYDLVLHTAEAGTYIFRYYYEDSKYKLSIYFPQARLVKQKYVYFDARNETNWNSSNFDARFWFKYYDSGSDNGSVDCNKTNAVENWVYYVLVPDHDYIGQIQLNRLDPSNHNTIWCSSNIALAKDRTSTAQNCLKEETGKADDCSSWTPQWTTYCPPMSDVDLEEDGTTLSWGGDGSSGDPYLIPTGASIKVKAINATKAVDDDNMTIYYQFKKAGTEVQAGSTTASATITASGSTGTKEAVTVEAYNYYNSTSGTHLASNEIYYEVRTPYTIAYNKGSYGTSSRASETKLKGVNFATPNSAVFTRTGYTQTGWATSDGGSQLCTLGGNYTSDADATLYPVWTANNYTVTFENLSADAGHKGSLDTTVTYGSTTNMGPIEKPTKTHYDFGGYWTSSNSGSTLTTQLIDENGNWIKNVTDYTGTSGDNATWVYAGDITLYAKWTEHEYAVTLAISPAGAGTTSPASSTTAKYVTASGDIEAIPNAGYSFSEWDFSKTDAVNDIYCADGYSSTSNPVRIHAVHDGTLTANFTPNTYTVRFENLGADAGHKGSLDTTVTFNDTINMKGGIEVPSKSHYDFGGYYISTDQGVTLTNIQIIDANGNWNKDVSGYTGTKDNVASWVCAGDTVLYAKWTETAYTITPSVSPAGAGSVNTVTDAHLVTSSSEITATPANAAWVFDHWELGTHVGIAGGKGTTDNPITVTSDMNSTITAYFKPRYVLVGSIWNDNSGSPSGGMPGWMSHGYGADFTFNSFTALGTGDGTGVDLSCSRTLTANTTYKFQIYDRIDGNYGYRPLGDGTAVFLGDGDSFLFDDPGMDVWVAATGAGTYTFRITNITESTGHYYPTVTIERPHQVYFGTGYAGIDNLSSVTSGTTGGTLAVTTSAGSLSNEDWVNYGTDVTYTPSAATGYTFEGFYTSDAYSSRFTQDNPWVHYNVTGDDHVYAKFEEKSTSVTLANDGHGKVQISSTDKTSTTCGVTTTRELTAVPNDGYMFSSWSKEGTDITLTSTTTNPTTLSGNGAGATSDQTVTANFTYRWALEAESDGWGRTEFIIENITTDVSGDVVGYVEISLAANTSYQFTMKDLLTNDIYKNNNTAVQYMTYTNHTDWGFATTYTYNCGITTAGRGTYRFTWNVTDKTMTVTYPTSYLVNLGVKSITYEGAEGTLGTVTATDASSNTYSNGQYIANGETVTITATPHADYDFVGWWGSDAYSGEHFATDNPTSWTVGAAVNAYAKFTEKSNTFSAASGSNWSTTANWSAGHVPTIHEVAVINEPVTVDIAHAVANRIVLDQNSHTGKLTIQANKGLEVVGTITRTTDGSDRLATREEDLVLESSSAGNASLIFNNSNSCAATVQMYSKATIVGDTWNWQYVGTPFTGSSPLYNYYGSWMYKWNNGWDVVSGGDELDPFVGYCLTQSEATTHVMGGTLVPTTSSGSISVSGDVVLANSWTAPIWIGGFTASTFTSSPATIYLFNTGMAKDGASEYVSGEEAGTYVTVPVNAAEYTGNEFIAPMQGFFVTNYNGKNGSITLNYNDLVRPSGVHTGIVAGPMKVRKQEETKPDVMKIRANGALYNDRVVILAREDFSEGFDNGWDGEKLSFGTEAPSVYVINQQGGYDAVSAIPSFEGTLVGFRAGANNSCTLNFEYDGYETLYLNDLQEQQSTLIDAGHTYTFTTSAYDSEARFIISASPIRKITTGNENVGAEAAKVRKLIINDKVYIIRAGRLFSVDGQMVK